MSDKDLQIIKSKEHEYGRLKCGTYNSKNNIAYLCFSKNIVEFKLDGDDFHFLR